ncbi:MAG: glycosyltransferase [Succinivibrionaceae bacterium]|nr:glycosyltransferase [Succinivibrionaceae bacterium]
MKILIVVRKLTQGGLQQQIVTFARTALARGIETHVLILKSSKNELALPEATIVHRARLRSLQFSSIRGVATYLAGHLLLPLICRKTKDFLSGRFIGRWFKQEFLPQLEQRHGPMDYVFIRGQGAFDLLNSYRAPGKSYRYIDGNPYPYSPRIFLFKPVAEKINRLTYGDADFICVSEDLAAKLKAITDSCGARNTIRVFRNFMDIHRIRKLAQERPKQDLPARYIVSVGRLVSAKRQDLIIDAMVYLPRDLSLVLVGSGSRQSDLEAHARSVFPSEEDRKRIIFLGNQDNPYPYIKNALALAHASEKEGFGLVFVEALILDTPVVAMESIGGMRDVLQGEILSKQITSRSTAEFASCIERTISNPYHSTEDMYRRYDAASALDELLTALGK